MTERLVDITARIEGVRQLGAVVNAMRGIAAARAQQARGQLDAVDNYAEILEKTIGRVLTLDDRPVDAPIGREPRRVIVVFCAEQGFAGAFSERVLEAIAGDTRDAQLFLIGTRGYAIARERGVNAQWHAAMPAHSRYAPRLANHIAEALYGHIAAGEIAQLEAVFLRWQPGQEKQLIRDRLFPLDISASGTKANEQSVLTYLPPAVLLDQLTSDYIHSRLCHAILHAFSAENEARIEAMAAAHAQIDRQMSDLQHLQRRVRQQEITSEIIELATGEMASSAANRNVAP